MSKHTPGPWMQSDATVYALTPDGKRNRFWTSVQSVCRPEIGEASQEECRANAHLIAAAPDLLEAAKKLIRAGEEGDADLAMEAHDDLRAAIAKAEGKS